MNVMVHGVPRYDVHGVPRYDVHGVPRYDVHDVHRYEYDVHGCRYMKQCTLTAWREWRRCGGR